MSLLSSAGSWNTEGCLHRSTTEGAEDDNLLQCGDLDAVYRSGGVENEEDFDDDINSGDCLPSLELLLSAWLDLDNVDIPNRCIVRRYRAMVAGYIGLLPISPTV